MDMLETIGRRMRERKTFPAYVPHGELLALTVCFVFGAGAGLIFSGLQHSSAVSAETLFTTDYAQALWNCCIFHIALIFLAGSVWGSALVPALTAVRAYVLTSAAAAVAAVVPGGPQMALLTVGIPALITVPCFFILASDCVVSSRRLAAASSGRSAPVPPAPLLRHCLLCFPALAAAAALEAFVVPILGAKLLA